MKGPNTEEMAKQIYSQEPQAYILALADKLKNVKEFEVPEWAHFVKSGTSRERPPVDRDFWYIRSASILRQLYIKGVVGVERLRTKYGSRKDRGANPDKFRKASGKIIRLILQQAEAAGLVEKVAKLQYGRRLTQTGRDLLDSIEVAAPLGVNIDEVVVEAKAIDVVEQDEDIQEDKGVNVEEKQEENQKEVAKKESKKKNDETPKEAKEDKMDDKVEDVNEETDEKIVEDKE